MAMGQPSMCSFCIKCQRRGLMSLLLVGLCCLDYAGSQPANSADASQASQTFKNADIDAKTLSNCGPVGNQECVICTPDLANVTSSCTTNPKCKAYTYDGKCGSLKSTGFPRTRAPGITAYVIGPDEKIRAAQNETQESDVFQAAEADFVNTSAAPNDTSGSQSAGSADASQASQTFKNADIDAKTLSNCGPAGNAECVICTPDVDNVTSSCTVNPKCKAYTYDGKCGSLKSTSFRRKRVPGITAYVLGADERIRAAQNGTQESEEFRAAEADFVNTSATPSNTSGQGGSANSSSGNA